MAVAAYLLHAARVDDRDRKAARAGRRHRARDLRIERCRRRQGRVCG
jgi:hypothetical protein